MKEFNLFDINYINNIIEENQLPLPLNSPQSWNRQGGNMRFNIIWNKSYNRRIVGICIHGYKIKSLRFPQGNRIIYLECGNNSMSEIDLSTLNHLHYLIITLNH
ncbi:MAG: hypothetical protein IKY58_05405, partial [Paludibacteraceae bacterium]|nr:hypothetical protein [Paludibacteraceae bacterium]